MTRAWSGLGQPSGGSGTETPLRWVPGGVRRAPRGGPQPGAGPGAPSSRPPARSWGARREAGHVPVAATRLPGAGFVTVLEACDLGDFVVTVMLLLTHCERRGRVSGTLRTPGRAHALTRLGRATRSRASGDRALTPRVVSPKTPSSGRWGEQSKVAPGVPGAEVGELRPAPLISL